MQERDVYATRGLGLFIQEDSNDLIKFDIAAGGGILGVIPPGSDKDTSLVVAIYEPRRSAASLSVALFVGLLGTEIPQVFEEYEYRYLHSFFWRGRPYVVLIAD